MDDIDDGLAISDSRVSPDLILEGDEGDDSLRIGGAAPKRFKSSFIFFSMEKHKEIKAELRAKGIPPKSANITKLVSEAWRNLSDENKKKYQEMAVMDKVRYAEETASYKDNSGTRRSRKKPRDPDAPKRPMSAFLAFANIRRAEVKAENPECSNGEISKLLSSKWRQSHETVRQKYRDAELASWMSYKEQMTDFRKKNDGRKRVNKAHEPSQQKKKQKSRPFDDDSLAGNSFDDPSFTGLGSLEPTNSATHDDIMVASAALRGVRSAGPSNMFHFGSSGAQSGGFGLGGGNLMGLDFGGLQNFQQNGGNNFNVLLSGNLNSLGGGIQTPGGNSMNHGNGNFGSVGFNQDNNTGTRGLLDMGLPLQQYGSYAGVLGSTGSSQTNMLMQAALRGSSAGGLLGLSGVDQHSQLSAQLASPTGGQHGMASLAQPQPNPLPNLGSLGGGIGLTLDQGLAGLGGNLGSNSANHDKRLANMSGSLIHGLMNESSNSIWMG